MLLVSLTVIVIPNTKNRFQSFLGFYTPSPTEAEFDGLTAWFETIQLCP